MKKIFIPLIASMFFFSTCAKEDENDLDNASVSLSDNATTFSFSDGHFREILPGWILKPFPETETGLCLLFRCH